MVFVESLNLVEVRRGGGHLPPTRALHVRADGTCRRRFGRGGGRGSVRRRSRLLSVLRVVVDQVDLGCAVTLGVQLVHAGGHLLPDGAYHIPLFAGVNIRSTFSHPVAQVLPEVTWNLGLESTVRHEDAKGVPGQVDPEVLIQVLSR